MLLGVPLLRLERAHTGETGAACVYASRGGKAQVLCSLGGLEELKGAHSTGRGSAGEVSGGEPAMRRTVYQ